MAGTVECLHARFSDLSALCRTSSGALRNGAPLLPVVGRAPFLGDCARPTTGACGSDAIEPPKKVSEEDELRGRGEMHSRKWTLTTHPKKEP